MSPIDPNVTPVYGVVFMEPEDTKLTSGHPVLFTVLQQVMTINAGGEFWFPLSTEWIHDRRLGFATDTRPVNQIASIFAIRDNGYFEVDIRYKDLPPRPLAEFKKRS